MYKDDYGNINCADNITCPYCDDEVYDSMECIPRDSDMEASFDYECESCGKTFHVTFDGYNQSNGFECKKICKRHNYKWDGKDTYTDHDLKYSISKTSNCYRCTKCGDIEFVYTKPDGTEYTKQEIKEWEKQRKQKRFYKDNPDQRKCEGDKVFSITTRNAEIYIITENPEGNKDLFHAINRKLSKIGFSIQIEDRYKKEYKTLQRWNRYLERDWLKCVCEYSRNSIKYEFFQNIYLEKDRDAGRYCFEKYNLMDTKMKTEFRSIRKYIIDYLENNYIVKEEDIKIHDWHGYVEGKYLETQKYPGLEIIKHSPEWNDTSQGKNKDGKMLKSGDFMAAYDERGRLWCGRMYDRCGTYKFMVHNDKTYSLFSARECFELKPDTPRKVIPKDAKSVLNSLLKKKIEEKDFERCIHIQKAIDRLGE